MCFSCFDRSAAIVMAYLMKSKGWKLAQSYQWVKERRPPVELNQGVNKLYFAIVLVFAPNIRHLLRDFKLLTSFA